MFTSLKRIVKYLQPGVNLNDQEKLCNKCPFAFLNTVTEKILPPLKPSIMFYNNLFLYSSP